MSLARYCSIVWLHWECSVLQNLQTVSHYSQRVRQTSFYYFFLSATLIVLQDLSYSGKEVSTRVRNIRYHTRQWDRAHVWSSDHNTQTGGGGGGGEDLDFFFFLLTTTDIFWRRSSVRRKLLGGRFRQTSVCIFLSAASLNAMNFLFSRTKVRFGRLAVQGANVGCSSVHSRL